MYHVAPPKASLKRYIHYFWAGEVELLPKASFTHLAPASSCVEWLFHCLGEFASPDPSGQLRTTFKAGIYGPASHHHQYATTSLKASIFGLRLYPHILPALVGIPTHELTNQSVDITTLLGPQGTQLTEKVIQARTFTQRVGIISDFLQARIGPLKSKYRHVEAAIFAIHQAQGQVNLTDLVGQSCLSQRQFERNFKDLTGMTLQSHLKLVRFESALALYAQNQYPLTDLALACGYYDQAHFNHDFKQFTGHTPTQYWSMTQATF